MVGPVRGMLILGISFATLRLASLCRTAEAAVSTWFPSLLSLHDSLNCYPYIIPNSGRVPFSGGVIERWGGCRGSLLLGFCCCPLRPRLCGCSRLPTRAG